MKRIFMLGAILLGMGSYVLASPLVTEQPIKGQGTAGCVSISTSAWTAVPTSATAGRTGLYVTEVASNTANMAGHLGTTTTPTLGITIWPVILKPGITQFHGISDASILYLRSLHTSSEDVCYQEVK